MALCSHSFTAVTRLQLNYYVWKTHAIVCCELLFLGTYHLHFLRFHVNTLVLLSSFSLRFHV